MAKLSVEDFLEWDLDSWNWVKELTHEEVDAEIAKLPVAPDFNTERPPLLHQKHMFLLGATLRRFLFFADMGTGKTAVVLYILAWLKKMGLPCTTLVWCTEHTEHAKLGGRG